MKLSRGIRNFWVQLGNTLVTPAFVTLICMLWLGWQAIFGGLILSVILVFFYLHKVKTKMLRSLSDVATLHPAIVDDFPHVDQDWLQQQTMLLESLGFVQLADYSPSTALKTGFGRGFAHPQHCCFAEIGQLYVAQKQTVLTHSVISSVLAQDWNVAHVNRLPHSNDSIAYMWRRQKGIRFYVSTTTLDVLFKQHLDVRQKIMLDLGITASTDMSWSAYLNREQQSAQHRHQAVQRKPLLLAMLEATFFDLKPKSEWLGDYPKLAARRSRDR